MQIVEPAHQALEVADAVAVGIHESADGEAIDDRVLVPEIVDHAVSTHAAIVRIANRLLSSQRLQPVSAK